MNSTIRPVVVGVVDKQPTALGVAIRQASAGTRPLWVVHCVGTPSQAAGFYADVDVLEDLSRTGQGVLDEAKRIIDREAPGLVVEYILSTGEPLHAIENLAANARLVVLGVDDVPWYDRLLRSKVAGQLALHGPCPVIVVPEHDFADDFGGDIVVTLDGKTTADGPMIFALEQARAHHASLHALHAIPPGTAPDDADRERAKLSEILNGWRVKYPDVRILETFGRENPSSAAVRATETASLVVVGRPHKHTMPFALSHPFATEVLKRAHCPVAVVDGSYQGG